MGRYRKLLLGFFLLAANCQMAAAGEACMPFVKWVNGQTVDGYMTVRSGRVCHIRFRSRGPTDRTAVLGRPSHGAVSVNGGVLTYRPRAGYVGGDTFTYAHRGIDSNNTPMNASIRVNVTVTP